jgi:hypothetical protein
MPAAKERSVVLVQKPFRRALRNALAAAALSLLLVPSAAASHQFGDVADAHPFHTEIGILRDANITSGCTATLFCPDDFVKRQAMAAFVDRALGLVVRPGESVLKGVPGSRVQILDDGVSLVRTNDGALELHHNGFRVLRLHGRSFGPNVIGGAPENAATAFGAAGNTIAGGGHASLANTAMDSYGTIGGGRGNRVHHSATVGGGFSNTASGNNATVGGGTNNTAGSHGAAIGGGDGNVASHLSTVPGGYDNAATGNYSFAAGYRARAAHESSFVWADSSNATPFSTNGNFQFAVRAAGGAHFVRGGNTFPGIGAAITGVNHVAGEAAWLWQRSSTNTAAVAKLLKHPSANAPFLRCADADGVNAEVNRCHINSAGTFVGGSDFAESLPAVGGKRGYEPGDVVVASTRRPGAVLRSTRPNDAAVMGVYSTRPAVLGADKGGVTRVGADEIPVAITGIVPVKVTAANGAIRPGDLLVTSREPGRAMRASANPRVGTVVGKALGALPRGRGTIRMLVMLR